MSALLRTRSLVLRQILEFDPEARDTEDLPGFQQHWDHHPLGGQRAGPFQRQLRVDDPLDFAGMNEEYATWFPSETPTRFVAKLGVQVDGLLVSVRMTAYLK